MDIQQFGGAFRQLILAVSIRHDVRIVAEIMLKTEGVPELMRNDRPPPTVDTCDTSE